MGSHAKRSVLILVIFYQAQVRAQVQVQLQNLLKYLPRLQEQEHLGHQD